MIKITIWGVCVPQNCQNYRRNREIPAKHEHLNKSKTAQDRAKLTINHNQEVGVDLSESAIKFYPRRHLAEKSLLRHFLSTKIVNNSETVLDRAKLTINYK